MNKQTPPDDLNRELEALLQSKLEPEEFARRLFELNYRRLKAKDPQQAEMMRACAIPRAFNAEIIGVLRDAPQEAERNARILKALLEFSFTLQRQDGDYVYHDNTRQMLLADWQKTENRPQFEIYQDRLLAFYTQRGKTAFETKAYQTALAYFNYALELRPEESELYHHRGGARLELGDYPAAEKDLQEALKRGFANAGTHFWMGTAHYYLQDYQAAVRDFSDVLELQPQDAAAYYNRGTAYADLKDYERAIADFERAVTLNPQDAAAFYNRACAYALQGQVEKALPDLRRAFELDQVAGSTRRVDLAQSDADFDPIRHHPDFQALLAAFSRG